MTEFQNIQCGVVGCGAMGQGIAQLVATAGLQIKLFDVTPGKASEALRQIEEILARMIQKGKIESNVAQSIQARIQIAPDLAGMSQCKVIFEAIIEDLAAKQELFCQLEKVIDDDCVLATNTSSLLITSIGAKCRRPERVVGAHFFNPVPLMKVVEIIPGVATEHSVVARLLELVKSFGHSPIEVTDTPGFLINHAGRGLYTEGIRILSEGIAPHHAIDTVLRDSVGFRLGPFELFDLTGLDVSFPVLLQIYHAFFEEPRFRPAPVLQRQVAANFFGRKVGRGFYHYEKGTKVEQPELPLPAVSPKRIWISPEDTRDHSWVAEWLQKVGLNVSQDEGGPRKNEIALMLPIGADATSTAVARGIDLAHAMALDPLIPFPKRITIMPTVATLPEFRDSLHAMIGRSSGVSVIHDSPGFIAQRVIAMIVNIAADIAQQRVATPSDIDVAVKAGLGYPSGPLEMGNSFGARTILAILDGLHTYYGDPRYRASPWLRRRAISGYSLLHVEP
jgi:3-hydroxybutyryl-CoA dehydrogenase